MAAPLLRLSVVCERQVLQIERLLHVMRESAIEVLDNKRNGSQTLVSGALV